MTTRNGFKLTFPSLDSPQKQAFLAREAPGNPFLRLRTSPFALPFPSNPHHTPALATHTPHTQANYIFPAAKNTKMVGYPSKETMEEEEEDEEEEGEEGREEGVVGGTRAP